MKRKSMKSILITPFITALLVAGVTQTAFGQSELAKRARLDGWGPFKFGQTIKEAAKAAGPNANVAQLAVSTSVEISGTVFVVGAIAFGSLGRVTDITIYPEKIKQGSRAECEQHFKPLLAMVTKKHGSPDAPVSEYEADGKKGDKAMFSFRDGAKIEVLWSFSDQPSKSALPWEEQCHVAISMSAGKTPRKMNF